MPRLPASCLTACAKTAATTPPPEIPGNILRLQHDGDQPVDLLHFRISSRPSPKSKKHESRRRLTRFPMASTAGFAQVENSANNGEMSTVYGHSSIGLGSVRGSRDSRRILHRQSQWPSGRRPSSATSQKRRALGMRGKNEDNYGYLNECRRHLYRRLP